MMVFAVLTIAKATLVCAAAFLLSHLCRRARASVRHLLFVLAFAALAALPGAGTLLPRIPVTIPAPSSAPASRTDVAAVRTSGNVEHPLGSAAPAIPWHASPTASFTLVRMIGTAWLMGLALFLIPVAVGAWQVFRLRRLASPWLDGRDAVQTLAPALSVHRPIDVLLHHGITGPMTCGVLKPAIILPSDAQRWSTAALRCALRHELEHVARWDFLIHGVSRMVCAAYWFHPFVWAAWRRLRLEAERACDDAVVQDEDASEYASMLVSVAQREQYGIWPTVAMAGRGDLAVRVAALLDRHLARGRVGRRRAIGLIVAGAVVVGGVASITVAQAKPQAQIVSVTETSLRFETISIARNQNGGKYRMMSFSGNAERKPGAGPDGRYQWLNVTNMPARQLIWNAYDIELRPAQGNGGFHQIDIARPPEWFDSDSFDIVARAPLRATREQTREMMRSLLADRFKLKAHFASKEFPAYAVVSARGDGSVGPRMTPSQLDCRSAPGASSPCGLSSTTGRLEGRGVTMAGLARLLSQHFAGVGTQIALDRPLIDRTGASGAFDFTLEWTPDASPAVSNAQNFRAALQEQLGLTLASQFAPEPVLVIDSIEAPTGN